jgi:hypothetical protein
VIHLVLRFAARQHVRATGRAKRAENTAGAPEDPELMYVRPAGESKLAGAIARRQRAFRVGESADLEKELHIFADSDDYPIANDEPPAAGGTRTGASAV